MNTKTVILITNTLGNGGAQRVQVQLINQWVRNGIRVIVLQTENREQYNYQIDESVEIKNIRSSSNRLHRYFLEIRQICQILNQNPDATVLAFVIHSIFLVSVCSFFTKNRIVFSERNDPDRWPKSAFRRMLRDWAFHAADHCVFQSEGAKQHFSAKIRNKSSIIPNPINPNLPAINEGAREKVILTACRLEKQKNLPMMIRAFARFSQENPEYTLEIYGRGEDEPQLISLIHDLSMDDKILLKGYSHNIYQEMNRSEIFALSSDFEGVSNSMLEAMAMGLPCVVTDCPPGGAKEVIESGRNGILVPVGDDQAMSEAFKQLSDDSSLAKSLSEEARKIREKYPVEKISEEWIGII